MPSLDIFNETINRLTGCTAYTGPEIYDIAATNASFYNASPDGSDLHKEVYTFLRGAFKAAELDASLEPAQRTEAIGRMLARYACNTDYNQSVVQRAHTDHEAAMRQAQAAGPNQTA